jgi:hypothetical protein
MDMEGSDQWDVVVVVAFEDMARRAERGRRTSKQGAVNARFRQSFVVASLLQFTV